MRRCSCHVYPNSARHNGAYDHQRSLLCAACRCCSAARIRLRKRTMALTASSHAKAMRFANNERGVIFFKRKLQCSEKVRVMKPSSTGCKIGSSMFGSRASFTSTRVVHGKSYIARRVERNERAAQKRSPPHTAWSTKSIRHGCHFARASSRAE